MIQLGKGKFTRLISRLNLFVPFLTEIALTVSRLDMNNADLSRKAISDLQRLFRQGVKGHDWDHGDHWSWRFQFDGSA